MEENLRNKLGFYTFLVIIVVFIVGGYFLTDYMVNYETKKENNKKEETKSYKIDELKNYIYFENEEVISKEAEIYYKEVFINIVGQEVLTDKLNKQNAIYKENIEYLDGKEITEELINYNYDNLYSLHFLEHKVFENDNYVSLVLEKYHYTCFDFIEFVMSDSYVFNIKNGVLLAEKDLLKLYNTTLADIKKDIKNLLIEKNKNDLIKIDETINDLEYSLYIDEYDQLQISFLVKTNEVDYNEVMEVK